LRFKVEETSFSVLNTQTNSIGASDSLSQLMEQSFKQDRETQYNKFEFKNHNI